uniref:Uncharacterized protein n=1 Tax=Steinernema glaseri TaxID=37863 RepID=A0A1I8AVL4_9BILA
MSLHGVFTSAKPSPRRYVSYQMKNADKEVIVFPIKEGSIAPHPRTPFPRVYDASLPLHRQESGQGSVPKGARLFIARRRLPLSLLPERLSMLIGPKTQICTEIPAFISDLISTLGLYRRSNGDPCSTYDRYMLNMLWTLKCLPQFVYDL